MGDLANRRWPLATVALLAVFGSTLGAVGESAAQASEPQILAEVTVEYVSQDGSNTVTVSPDGTLAAFALYEPVTNFEAQAPLAAVRLVDLTNPSRDETFSVSGQQWLFWNGEAPFVFSSDSASLFVPLETGAVVIDTDTFTVRQSLTLPNVDFGVQVSPAFDYYAVFDYSDPFSPLPFLIITETVTGEPVFAQEFPFGSVSFSEATPTAHVLLEQGVVALSLDGSGPEGFVEFMEGSLPGLPSSISQESPSGNILGISLQDFDTFASAGVVFVDISEGTVLATFAPEGVESFVDILTFSADEDYALVRVFTVEGVDTWHVVNLSTGESTLWDDPAAAGPLASVQRFFPSPNDTVGWNANENAFVFVDLAEMTFSVNPSLDTSGGYTYRDPVAYLAETDEVVFAAQDSDYSNWEFGEWPTTLPSGSITVTWVFEKVAISPDATATFRASAIGFDAAGTTLVGFSGRDGSTLTVWDAQSLERRESFALTSLQGEGSENSFEFWYPAPFDGGVLKVSPDGQNVYLALTQNVSTFDSEENTSTGVVVSVSTVTGDVQEIARFENAIIDAVDYHRSESTIVVGVVEVSDEEQWERSVTVVEVDLASGAVTTLTTLDQGVSQLARVSEDTLATTGFGALDVISLPTGSSVGKVVFGSGGSQSVHFSSDGTRVVGVERVENYTESGGEEFAGGTVYAASVPSSRSTGDAVATPITSWSGSTGGAGTFLPDGETFVFYADGQFEAFSGPDFTSIGVAQAPVDVPSNQFVVALVADPTGQTLWLGFGERDEVAFFVPVAMPDFLDASAADVGSAGGGLEALFGLNPQWLIPASLLALSLAGLGVWLGVLRRREKSVSLGGVA